MIRNEYKFRLDDIERVAGGYGSIVLKKIYFDHHIGNRSPKLVEAASMHGFESFISTSDVDLKLAVDATRIITTRDDIDLIAIASSDSDYLPVINEAKNYGKDTLILFGEKCTALQSCSRHSVDMRKYMEDKAKSKEPENGKRDS